MGSFTFEFLKYNEDLEQPLQLNVLMKLIWI